MKVEPYEGLLRFYVYSDKQPGRKYLVDLSENDGQARCDCDHYRIRLEPKLGFGRHVNAEEVQCKHIRAAKEYLGQELSNAAIKMEIAKQQKE